MLNTIQSVLNGGEPSASADDNGGQQPTQQGNATLEGILEGIKGMRFGGVREIDIPSPLAYGSEREICGSKNSPLKFLVLPIEVSEDYKKLSTEYNQIYVKYRKLQSEINSIGA